MTPVVVFTETLAVIADDDDDRVVAEAKPSEAGEYLADRLIDERDLRVVTVRVANLACRVDSQPWEELLMKFVRRMGFDVVGQTKNGRSLRSPAWVSSQSTVRSVMSAASASLRTIPNQRLRVKTSWYSSKCSPSPDSLSRSVQLPTNAAVRYPSE